MSCADRPPAALDAVTPRYNGKFVLIFILALLEPVASPSAVEVTPRWHAAVLTGNGRQPTSDVIHQEAAPSAKYAADRHRRPVNILPDHMSGTGHRSRVLRE